MNFINDSLESGDIENIVLMRYLILRQEKSGDIFKIISSILCTFHKIFIYFFYISLRMLKCKILGFHGVECEEYRLLG
jgi:hypothetical protein